MVVECADEDHVHNDQPAHQPETVSGVAGEISFVYNFSQGHQPAALDQGVPEGRLHPDEPPEVH